MEHVESTCTRTCLHLATTAAVLLFLEKSTWNMWNLHARAHVYTLLLLLPSSFSSKNLHGPCGIYMHAHMFTPCYYCCRPPFPRKIYMFHVESTCTRTCLHLATTAAVLLFLEKSTCSM